MNHHVCKPAFARWTMEYVSGIGWRLVDPDGKPGTAIYQNQDYAQTALDWAQARTDAARHRRRRACLCCGQEFLSQGLHNRMCGPCRQRDMAPDGLGPVRQPVPRRA